MEAPHKLKANRQAKFATHRNRELLVFVSLTEFAADGPPLCVCVRLSDWSFISPTVLAAAVAAAAGQFSVDVVRVAK